MSGLAFAGRVIVVAGEGEHIDRAASTLLDADALVAVVSRTSSATTAAAWFRVDPADPEVWDRVIPHVEQRLGPIDAAVTTSAVHQLVRRLLLPDLERRGHGDVVDVDTAADVDEAISRLSTLL